MHSTRYLGILTYIQFFLPIWIVIKVKGCKFWLHHYGQNGQKCIINELRPKIKMIHTATYPALTCYHIGNCFRNKVCVFGTLKMHFRIHVKHGHKMSMIYVWTIAYKWKTIIFRPLTMFASGFHIHSLLDEFKTKPPFANNEQNQFNLYQH